MARIALPDGDQPDVVKALMLRPALREGRRRDERRGLRQHAGLAAARAGPDADRGHQRLPDLPDLAHPGGGRGWRHRGAARRRRGAGARRSVYSDAERVALEFTELFCGDSLAIDDDLMARARGALRLRPDRRPRAGDRQVPVAGPLHAGARTRPGLRRTGREDDHPMSRTYRVVQWSTGHVGKHAIAGIDARPDLELVGVWVSNPDKVGKDAGELAGLGRTLGVAATNDADALLALKPDCIVHTAWADDRLLRGARRSRAVPAGRHQRRVEQPGLPAVSARRRRDDGRRRDRGGARGWRVDLRQRHRPGLRQRRAAAASSPASPSGSSRCAASSCSTTRRTTRVRCSRT